MNILETEPGRASRSKRKTRKKNWASNNSFDHYYITFFLLFRFVSLWSVKNSLHYIWSKLLCGSFVFSHKFPFSEIATKIWWNLPFDFNFYLITWEILSNFCGLLRIYELPLLGKLWVFLVILHKYPNFPELLANHQVRPFVGSSPFVKVDLK